MVALFLSAVDLGETFWRVVWFFYLQHGAQSFLVIICLVVCYLFVNPVCVFQGFGVCTVGSSPVNNGKTREATALILATVFW